MLDLHVLTLDSTPAPWVEMRRYSIQRAALAAGYPVAVHEVAGIYGHIGQGRHAAYRMGENPYVTYVDCDDYLLEHALAELGPAMRSGCHAAAPYELKRHGNVIIKSPQVHHLICYSRDIAEAFDHQQWRVCGDVAMSAATRPDVVESYGYVHRMYESPGRILRRSHHEEMKKAYGQSAR